jgi:ABC-type polysaccharide/polyol phosphate transport system ATPase subunit
MRRSNPNEIVRSPYDPALVVEHVTRRYNAERWGRHHELFARLGGIRPGLEHEAFIDDDEDADDDGFDDLDDQEPLAPTESKLALDDVSFSAEAGSAIGLVGPPGSGKSVLLRVIAGIAPPTEGTVLVRGMVAPLLLSTQKLFPRELELRRAIPFMWMILQIDVVRPRRRVAAVFELLGEPELAARRVSMTRGWPIWRRILYAMVLVLEPHVLLIDCDLPDGPFGDVCRQRIGELRRRGTIVLVTGQDVESVAWIADRVIHLRRGRVVREEVIENVLVRDSRAVIDRA